MIGINKPPNDTQLKKKATILSITRKDEDPIPSSSPVFVNEKFAPTSIECFPSKDRKQTCIISNIYGQKTIINGIGFINQQVKDSVVNVFNHPDGTLRMRVDFKEASPICEIFGIKPNLNLKCSDAPSPIPSDYGQAHPVYQQNHF